MSFAAGLHAKEKRDKTSKGLLPRPPTRRGQRPPDPTVTSVNNIPVLALFHQLMPSKCFDMFRSYMHLCL